MTEQQAAEAAEAPAAAPESLAAPPESAPEGRGQPEQAEAADQAGVPNATLDDQSPESDPDSLSGDQLGKARRDAAKYRERLRDTETERDQYRDQLTSHHRAMLEWRAANNPGGPVDPQLLDAAGVTTTDLLGDDGGLDMNKVDAAINDTAAKYKVQRGGFTPNRGQGQSGSQNQIPATPSLAQAFQPRRR